MWQRPQKVSTLVPRAVVGVELVSMASKSMAVRIMRWFALPWPLAAWQSKQEIGSWVAVWFHGDSMVTRFPLVALGAQYALEPAARTA